MAREPTPEGAPSASASASAPADEVRRLLDGISGNTINGLGETVRRRPTPILWHDPARLVHADLERWLEARFQAHPDLKDFHLRYGGRGPAKPVPLAPERAEDTPERWVARLRAFALANEADLVGIARLDPEWVYDGYEVDLPWIVILGVAMDHARLAKAPEMEAEVEVMATYNRGTRAARALANWIRSHGWEARAHGGPRAGPVNMIPAALASGFGELGKHGSLINRRFGSSFRLAAVLTELPLAPDRPDTFGADDFCARCRLCAEACPPAAIFETKQTVRGTRKWYVDFDRCIPYFGETWGCGICIAVCPWSRPGVAPRLAEKMTGRRRRAKAASEHSEGEARG